MPNSMTSFKFQSDSINTEAGGTNYAVCEKPLNSNLILLILPPAQVQAPAALALNSNLILLILIIRRRDTGPMIFL